MFSEITPLLILLAAALIIFGGTELARRAKLPEAIGSGATLWLIAIGVGLFAANWRAWEAGGVWGDRLLTYSRLVGLAGLLFLAGTRFHGAAVNKSRVLPFAVFGGLLFATSLLLLGFVADQPVEIAALISAAVVSSSLWLPAHLGNRDAKARPPDTDIITGTSTLTAVAVAGLYFIEVLVTIPAASRNTTAFLIVGLYELVKAAVLFGFAYFVVTRFLQRAKGRVSVARAEVGFILLSVLFFALISLALGQLGTMVWAFFAGALWRQTDSGEEFSRSARPIASALLMSLVFVSLPLQVHGRPFILLPALVAILVFAALVLKVLFVCLLSLGRSSSKASSLKLAAITAFPGEIGILFLSFSITRWVIDGAVFFTLLGLAFIPALLVPIFSAADNAADNSSTKRRLAMNSGVKKVLFSGFCLALVLFIEHTAAAQQLTSQPATQEVQLGSGMSVITPGLMEIGAKTKLFLALTEKIPITLDQQRKLESLYLEVQMYSVQREADLDVADAELKRLLTRDTVDLGAVKTKMREIESIRFDSAVKRIETLLRAIAVLSHEQHMKVILLARDLEGAAKPREPVYQ